MHFSSHVFGCKTTAILLKNEREHRSGKLYWKASTTKAHRCLCILETKNCCISRYIKPHFLSKFHHPEDNQMLFRHCVFFVYWCSNSSTSSSQHRYEHTDSRWPAKFLWRDHDLSSASTHLLCVMCHVWPSWQVGWTLETQSSGTYSISNFQSIKIIVSWRIHC